MGMTNLDYRVRTQMTRSHAAPMSTSEMFKKAREIYLRGNNPTRYRRGFRLLKSAAARGNSDAHEWLGAAYDYGLGTRPNRRRAFEHYQQAAGPRNPNAEYHVAIFLLDGIGTSKNERAAIRWLRNAAIHGDQTAVHVLGQCYRSGRGVPRNPQKGFSLELKAARNRVLQDQYSVGT